MKSWFSVPKHLFTLLAIAAGIAVFGGAYLGFTLGSIMPGTSRLLPFLGIAVWATAWCEFAALCLRLRKGESAFTAATGAALKAIGWCMQGLAGITFICALIGSNRATSAFVAVEFVLLPGLFLAVYVVTKILRNLVTHAISLEEEQEGVV